MYQEIISRGYSPVADIFLIAMSMVCGLVSKETFVKRSKTTRTFKAGLTVIVFAAICNIMTYYTALWNKPAYYILAFRDVYFACLSVLFVLYIYYICVFIGYEKKKLYKIVHSAMLFNIIVVIFECLTPITKFGFHFENGIWQDPVWLTPFTISYIVNMIYIAIFFFVKRLLLINKVRNILLITQGICGMFVLVEAFRGHNSYLASTFALPIIVVLILLHSNPYNLETGALSAELFNDYLIDRFEDGKEDYLMCLKFHNDKGFIMPPKLGKVFYNFYVEYINGAKLYNPVSGCYLLNVKVEKNPKAYENIRTLIDDIFPQYYEEYKIDYKIVVFDKIKFDGINYFLDVLYYFMDTMQNNTDIVVEQESIKKYDRWQYIASELQDISKKEDLDDERVLVFCQPILNVEKNIYDTGEALMRLKLPEIGMVFPDEFIPIAEEKGYIHSLSKIILNRSCKFISEMEKKNYLIKRISVNFSTAELNIDTFVGDFKNVIRGNGITYDKIGVEFTESRNDADYENVVKVVSILRKIGTTIYLDDFGTGYSNYDRILSLDVNVIKFDRSLLLMSEQNKHFKKMTQCFAQVFHDSGYEVLYEGVENEDNEKFCKETYASYLQGYKYSKPIPIEEVESFLSKKDK